RKWRQKQGRHEMRACRRLPGQQQEYDRGNRTPRRLRKAPSLHHERRPSYPAPVDSCHANNRPVERSIRRSARKATTTTHAIAANMYAYAPFSPYMKINLPMPFVDAIISAEIARTKEKPSAMRNPVRTSGKALRKKIRSDSSRSVVPSASALQTRTLGVVTTP